MRFRLAVPIAAIFACIAVSPATATTFTQGEFYTWDQNIWGADPTDGSAASVVLSDFFTVFTAGLELGYHAPGGYVMDFSSGDAVLSYLPQSGAPGALDASLTDPTSSSSGVFGGQILALRLNTGYSDAGPFYDSHGHLVIGHPAGIAFGDLIYTGLTGSLASINGLNVRQVLDIGNVLLGGGAEPYDIPDFSDLVNLTNSAFEGGYVNAFADHFLLPDISTPVPEPASLPLMLAGLGMMGVALRSRGNQERT